MTPPSESYPESPLQPQTKVCPKCGIEKPIDDFYLRNNNHSKRASRCKRCENKRKVIQTIFPSVKICKAPNCVHGEKEQPIANFCKNSRYRDGLQPWCKDCFAKWQTQWHLDHLEKSKEYREAHIAKNPEWYKKKRSDRAKVRNLVRKEILKAMGIKSIKKFISGWARCIICSCRARALKKGVPFNMTVPDLLDKNTGSLPVFCPMFPHIRLDYDAGPDRRMWASVDRVVPELGYVSENVWVISQAANAWKNNGSNPAERKRIVEIMTGKKKKKEPPKDQPSLFE